MAKIFCDKPHHLHNSLSQNIHKTRFNHELGIYLWAVARFNMTHDLRRRA